MTHQEREALQAEYQAAKEAGDWKEAGLILMRMSEAYPCTCAAEALQANQGRCHCDRYAYLSHPGTAQELMLNGC